MIRMGNILQELQGLTTGEINLTTGEDNVFISFDTNGGVLTTYDKVVSKTGRVPVPDQPGKTVETITITRTIRTEQ